MPQLPCQPPLLTSATGVISGPDIVVSTRSLSDVSAIFEDQDSALRIAPGTPVYTTHSLPETGLPELLYSTTIIEPGQVGTEYFMTRGHFHTNPERGEFNVTLRGRGAMILMDRERNTWIEEMVPGSVHNLGGHVAHRVANTGDEPLIFLCVWMSDCGHDYETIATHGFGKRLRCIGGRPVLA